MEYGQIKRVFYLGLVNVVRNSFVSFSVILVMTVTLFIVGFSLLFVQVMGGVIDELAKKADMTVYFVPGTSEEQIQVFKERISELSYVREVIYVSQLTALEEYRKRHENDVDILKGLDILNENPFRARLSIRAYEPGELVYKRISDLLAESDIFSENKTTVIEKNDYYQNREIIQRLNSVITTTKSLSWFIIILLTFISFIIVFNIIRLIIYLSREEIQVMRLIGAEDWYIRVPFLVSGGIYGLVGSVIAMLLLYPASGILSPQVERFFGGHGLIDYYISEFIILVLVLMLIGVLVGSISSYLSTMRYLDD